MQTDLPPRPIEISIDKVMPCAMLTAEQKRELDVTEAGPGTINVDGLPSLICSFFGRAGVDYNTQIIPTGAETAVGGPGASVIQVNGFGAVRNIPENSYGPTPLCQVAVDAAPGHTIRVQVSTTPNRPELGNDELCRRATEAASLVMTTVVATASR